MDERERHKFIWGWLRLLLGFLQMSLLAAARGALLMVGLHWLTWALIAGSAVTGLTSYLLYRGQADPHLDRRK